MKVKGVDGLNLRQFEGHTTSTTTGVGYSPDGRYVVSGGIEVLTRLWHRANAAPHRVLPGHGAGTQAAAFSPDGQHVLTTFGAPVFSARLSNPDSGSIEREFIGHTSWLLTAVFSPDGQRVATGAQDGTVRLWDVATGTLLLSRQISHFYRPLCGTACEGQLVERPQIWLGAVVAASPLPQLKNPPSARTPSGWRKFGQTPGQLQLPDLSDR